MTVAADTSLRTPVRQARDPRRRLFWCVLVAVWALVGAWALATPLMASPDEPDHVNQAAAVVRGQLSERTVETYRGTQTVVELPGPFATTTSLPGCFAFAADETADCAPEFDGDPDVLVDAATFAGRYNPIYYAVVGLPSLVWPDEVGLYGMRLVSGLLVSALLASAVTSLSELRRPRWALVGLVVAVTPTVVFLGGTVNPIAIEVAAAVCVWAAFGAAFTASTTRHLPRQLARVGIAGSLLVNSRGLSPLWLAAIVVGSVLLITRPRFHEVVRHRATWVWAAVGAVSSAFALLWILTRDVLGTQTGLLPDLTIGEAVVDTLVYTPRYMREMVGVFGWLDTTPPWATYVVWAGLVGFLALLALLVARGLPRVLLVGLVVSSFVVPLLIQAPTAQDTGFIWQGRYLLPLVVGLPLVAGTVLAGAPSTLVTGRRALGMVLGLAGVGQVGAFVWAVRRYAVGGSLVMTDAPVQWQPPGGLVLLCVVFTTAWVTLSVLLLRLPPPDEATPEASATVGPTPAESFEPTGTGAGSRPSGSETDRDLGAAAVDR